ncbi:hypothetical protein [Legionella maioricensis]|uniref:Uncharacterized protein n=1 Tax=Legionella maioricensis TaxID=2896528 RepID=A0A9X2CYP9_9GAMM|nr:hypothetical protein [Legionella maioricensis]MCL9683349.1 hypothetical protein [Legionella maioricensis]MCL9685955.1 hypothetical protein [Legionella maioricensis]
MRTEYKIGVCVKETNQENGPGHVSALLIKQKEGKTKVYHTSFFPSMLGSIVNGITIGSIPVKGLLAQDHMQDVEEADHVLVTSIPKEQFQKAKDGQKEFSNDVQIGRRVYSVFRKANPLANLLSKVINGAGGAQSVIEKHKKEGYYPPEDYCGIHVFDDDHPKIEKIRVDNCTSSVTHVLRKAGYNNFQNPGIPTDFTSELEKHGFTKVDKEEFVKEHSNSFEL